MGRSEILNKADKMKQAMNRITETETETVINDTTTVFETIRGDNKTVSIRIFGDLSNELVLKLNAPCMDGTYGRVHTIGECTWINLILDCDFENQWNPSRSLVAGHNAIFNFVTKN